MALTVAWAQREVTSNTCRKILTLIYLSRHLYDQKYINLNKLAFDRFSSPLIQRPAHCSSLSLAFFPPTRLIWRVAKTTWMQLKWKRGRAKDWVRVRKRVGVSVQGRLQGWFFGFIWTSQLLQLQRRALSGLQRLWSYVSDPGIQEKVVLMFIYPSVYVTTDSISAS